MYMNKQNKNENKNQTKSQHVEMNASPQYYLCLWARRAMSELPCCPSLFYS